jgi:hypothetical protein
LKYSTSLYIYIEVFSLIPIVNFGGSPQISGKGMWQAADHKKKTQFFLPLLWRSRLEVKN